MKLPNRQRRSSLVLVFVLGAVLIIVVIAIGLGSGVGTGSPFNQDNVTLPPPLENVEFPSDPVPYPTDWLNELKFPNEFTLVDSSSGTLPESTTYGWSAKFRYQGKPSEALKIISSFLEDKGWTIVENNNLESGGFSLLIQREHGNGIIVIDTDSRNASQTLIIATIFP